MVDLLDNVDNIEAALLRIDLHLASIPPGRNLITIDDHTDVLLDIRNILNTETSTPS